MELMIGVVGFFLVAMIGFGVGLIGTQLRRIAEAIEGLELCDHDDDPEREEIHLEEVA